MEHGRFNSGVCLPERSPLPANRSLRPNAETWEANSEPRHTPGNPPAPVADAVVPAAHHTVEHTDDHAAELGLVQQRHGPHRQQLLESVYDELLRWLECLQRDLGLVRDRTSYGSGRHATGDGAAAHEQPAVPD